MKQFLYNLGISKCSNNYIVEIINDNQHIKSFKIKELSSIPFLSTSPPGSCNLTETALRHHLN